MRAGRAYAAGALSGYPWVRAPPHCNAPWQGIATPGHSRTRRRPQTNPPYRRAPENPLEGDLDGRQASSLAPEQCERCRAAWCIPVARWTSLFAIGVACWLGLPAGPRPRGLCCRAAAQCNQLQHGVTRPSGSPAGVAEGHEGSLAGSADGLPLYSPSPGIGAAEPMAIGRAMVVQEEPQPSYQVFWG